MPQSVLSRCSSSASALWTTNIKRSEVLKGLCVCVCVCVCQCGGGRQTQVTLLVPWWPRARGHAPTFHPPGTTDLEGIPSLQVPDQCISFVDQYDQFIQQQLLSSLLGFSFLPVCKIRGTFRL
ncbi:hypothetical protein ILYODFUR_007817 [Ilyodon furcidens]|uniref:Uncharacterized protein n=1 Tax=Ilyodon furcidens TaxID=33524 RepID=A0ABV0TIK4_9TELE